MAEPGPTRVETSELCRIATQFADCLERKRPVPAGLIRDLLRRSERMGAMAERTGLQNLAKGCNQILDLLGRAFDLAELFDAGRKSLHVRRGKVIRPDTKPWRSSRRQTQPITLRNEDVDALVAALRGIPDRIEESGEQLEALRQALPHEPERTAAVREAAEPPELAPKKRALLVLMDHPDWPVRKIAKAVGCSRTTLYGYKDFRAALAIIRGGKRELPRGRKKAGDIEAFE